MNTHIRALLLACLVAVPAHGCESSDDGGDGGSSTGNGASGACGPQEIGEVLTGFFFDINGDGVIEATDGVDFQTGGPISTGDTFRDATLSADGNTDADFDSDGAPDTLDYDGDGDLDNRFYFNDAADWVPDKDSFDDYEDAAVGIPRARTPVPGTCAADGIETGPLDLGFTDYRPSRYCRRSPNRDVGPPCSAKY